MIKNQYHIVKIVIFGDHRVGKTSISARLDDEELSQSYEETIGVEFMSKMYSIQNKNAKVQIWDPSPFCGFSSSRSILKAYISSADGFIIMYDITDDKSFDHIKYWLNDIEIENKRHVPIIVIGNKSDLENQRKVETEKAKKYCQESNLEFYEISALTSKDDGINQPLVELSSKLMAKKEELLEKYQLNINKQQQSCALI